MLSRNEAWSMIITSFQKMCHSGAGNTEAVLFIT
nr:MAG TPA: hypothetical protein [Caudoviricetes sp.]